jgi:hypothetical protein
MRGQRQTLLDRLPLLIGSTQQTVWVHEDRKDLPPKPPRMHWRTYHRLVDRYEKYDQQWSLEAMRRFGMWL